MKYSNNSHDPTRLTSSVVIEGPLLAEITFCVFKCCCTQSSFSLTQNERHSKLSYQMCHMWVYGMRTTLLTWSWCHMSLPRFLEGRLYQDWKEEAAVLQSSAGQVPAAQDLLPFCWLFCGSSSIRQVEFVYTVYTDIQFILENKLPLKCKKKKTKKQQQKKQPGRVLLFWVLLKVCLSLYCVCVQIY